MNAEIVEHQNMLFTIIVRPFCVENKIISLNVHESTTHKHMPNAPPIHTCMVGISVSERYYVILGNLCDTLHNIT